MSEDAQEYVKRSVVVRSLPAAEKAVLMAIARKHRLEVNCAWCSMRYIADECLIGGKDAERQARRLVARLEARGLVVRHMSVRGNNSQRSNEYELPGMQSIAVTEEMRQQMFKGERTRVAAQLELIPGMNALAARKAAPHRTKITDGGSNVPATADVLPAEGTDVMRSGAGRAARAVDFGGECPRLPGQPECPPLPGQRDPALDVSSEDSFEMRSPLPPLPPWKSAKPATERAAKACLIVEEAGGQQRRWREVEARDELGEALWAEVSEVLVVCGIAPESSRRRERNAVTEALRLYAQREGASIAHAGEAARTAWRGYEAAGSGEMLGVRRFFSEGLWLKPRAWGRRPASASSGAAVGMWRASSGAE